MGQKFRDQAGNIWEQGPDGNPVFVSGPQQSIQTKPADPTQAYKGPAAAAGLEGQGLNNQKARIDLQQAPIQTQGMALNNQQTQQQIQFEKSKVTSDLAGKFAADQRVKDYRTVLPLAAAAMAAGKGKQGDLSVVYGWAKAMDPQGSVREGDTDLATSSSSYIQQALQYVARINQGKGLPPEVRKGLLDEMRTKTSVLNQAYGEARNQYKELAQQGGLPIEPIVGPHDGVKYQNIESKFLGRPVQNATEPKSATPQDFDRILSDMIEQRKPVAEIRKTLKDYGSSIPPFQEKILDQYEAARVAGQSPQVQVQTLPGQSAFMGLAKGAKEATDRLAVGAQNLFNMIPGLPDSHSASDVQQATQNYFAGQNVDPTAETIGRLGGSALLTAPIRGPMTAGAIGNLLMTDSTSAGDIAKDAMLGAAGGKVADLGLRGAAALAAPEGRDAMRNLFQQGVQFSPGQMIGGAARKLEDRLTANPVLGPKIEDIRERGLFAANRIPANRALAPIGETLPDNIPAGHAAVDYTKQRLGNAYDSALNGQQVALDPTYVTRLNALGMRSNLRPQEFNTAADLVQREVGGAFQASGTPLGSMSGRDYKKLDSRLGQLVGDFRKSPNVFDRDIGGFLGDVKDQTRALVRRQSPGAADALRNADEGYANFKILERAAASNPATGIFTPGQLRTAVKAGDRSVGKGATARGEALMQDLASDMSETLPSTVGSSGTSEREQVNKMAPWVMGSLMSPLYSDLAQQFLAKTMLRQPGPTSKAVAKGLRALPRGMFGGIIPYGIDPAAGY